MDEKAKKPSIWEGSGGPQFKITITKGEPEKETGSGEIRAKRAEYIRKIEDGEIEELSQIAEEEFRRDKEVIKAALRRDYGFAAQIPDDLKRDRKFVLEMVGVNGLALAYFNDFKNDKEVVLKAFLRDSPAIQFASERLQKDKEVRGQFLDWHPEYAEIIEVGKKKISKLDYFLSTKGWFEPGLGEKK